MKISEHDKVVHLSIFPLVSIVFKTLSVALISSINKNLVHDKVQSHLVIMFLFKVRVIVAEGMKKKNRSPCPNVCFLPPLAVMSSMTWKSIAGRRRSPSEALAVQKQSLLFTRRSFLVSKSYITQTEVTAHMVSGKY